MNSKRLNSDLEVSYALVQDTRSGVFYSVKNDRYFLFGRLLKSVAIVIEEPYISRSHCSIRYENGKFLLKDNKSCAGTYLNYKKISNEIVLQNGDLIAFKDQSKTWDFIFKFCLLSNPNKKPRLDSTVENIGIFNISMEQLHNKIDIVTFGMANTFNVQIKELNRKVDNLTQLNDRYKQEIFKLQASKQLCINEIAILRTKCIMQKELLNKKIAKEEESVEILKTQINNLLKTDFKCVICNEMALQATITHCGHTFCEVCLKSWLSINNTCPTCRGAVNCTSYSFSLDSYISNICDLLGGTIKEQRLIQQSERNPPQVAKRNRRRRANQSSSGRR